MSTDPQPYYANPGAATHPQPNNYYIQQNNAMDPRKSIKFVFKQLKTISF